MKTRFSLLGLFVLITLICSALATIQLSPLVRAGAVIGSALAVLNVWAVWQGLARKA